jgi:hypothetical protein
MSAASPTDWFHRLFGFHEGSYEETRSRFEVDGQWLRSKENDERYGIGSLELVSLHSLRERARAETNLDGRLRAQTVVGDVRALHQATQNAGALFQVASQFNLLEMTSPDVSPEDGVTRYQFDRTQGPACAIAAGAATVYRNYFALVNGELGQTKERQLDGLAVLGEALSSSLGVTAGELWTMRNGYALCSRNGLELIADHLNSLSDDSIDDLRGMLHVGVHWGVEATDGVGASRPKVSQIFCSALPVAYTRIAPPHWKAFATLVLEAAYEATMWAAALNARSNGSNIVLLTRLGGGAFGNDDQWIDVAMWRALHTLSSFDLDVRLVSYGSAESSMAEMATAFK